jgi:AmmeMemoRadiSam system protein B
MIKCGRAHLQNGIVAAEPAPTGGPVHTSRPATLAGAWYPAEPAELARLVDSYLATGLQADAHAMALPAGRPLIGLAPHAGFLYSGPVAGRLFSALRGSPIRRLMILAPNHRTRLNRPALSGAGAFATPLGLVPVDTAAVARLAASGAFVVDDRAHRDEHAVEIQLPLVQRCWPERCPAIIPVLVPHLDEGSRAAAATALAAERDTGTFVLVSTDLTHYGAAYGYVPFTDDVPAALERLDSGALLRVLAGDGQALLEYGRRTGITMCGLEAAALALACGLPGGFESALLGYARSGDRDGDTTMSVSYAAALLCSGPQTPEATEAS